MTGGLTVLLVEDNPGDARFVEELLNEVAGRDGGVLPGVENGSNGVTIRHETTVDAGIGALQADDTVIDVVLQDLHLPDSEGMETVEAVLATTQRVPVVVLTGMRDAALGVDAVKAGAQDYLVKDDINADRLVYAIRYAIQRKQTERELRQRTKQLEIMNQLTRHDIRNDVSLVVGRLHELREKTDDRYDDTFAEVLAASNHVLQLTRTIGNTVEVVTSDDGPPLESIELEPLLRREIEQSNQLYETAEIEIDGEIPAVEVRANGLLSSVFGNLFSNAMMYNDAETPLVTVDVSAAEETVTIAVSDNGPGIPPRQRELLFSQESSSLDGSGIGIGLYLVGALVDIYGGNIWIEENEPTGTTFFIELERA